MDILLSTDNNYVMPTGVLMTSVCINNPDVELVFHIVTSQKLEEEHKLMHVADSYGAKCFFYVIDRSQVEPLPIGKKNMPYHITLDTYNRLFVTEFIPDSVHKVLYLDGDMICRKSLKPLFEMNLEGYPLGVCHDMNEVAHLSSGRLPYSRELGYFNAGMLLINLDYWRENHVTCLFEDVLRNYYDLVVMHDQDILNFAFCGNVKWLPVTYNFQSGFLYPSTTQEYIPEIKSEIESVMCDPAVIHFSAGVKPWNVCCTNPQRWVWRYYRDKSLWRETRLANLPIHNARDLCKGLAYRFVLQYTSSKRYRRIKLKY